MDTRLLKALRIRPITLLAPELGLDLLTEDLHGAWLQDMVYGREDSTLLGHRGSYKTTTLSLAISLIMILYPQDSIIFLRKTDDDVKEVIRQVKNILQSDIMQYIARDLYGRRLDMDGNAYEITTGLNRDSHIKGASQLLGLGISSSITGKHADRIFTDDIVNVKDRASRAEREQTKAQYMELENVRNRGGRIYNSGTPWHKEDAISTLMPNVKKFDCYSTGLISPAKLQEIRSRMTPSLFAANYELKHIADGSGLFGPPAWHDGEISAIYGGMGHVDAAYGGDDYCAYTILKQTPDGYIGYGRLWRGHIDSHIREITAIHRQLRAGSIYCETNGDKGYLARDLRSAGLMVRPYAERENKYIKISTFLKRDWDRIRWIQGTDPKYIDQICDYTESAQHDDAPDSAASLLRAISAGPEYVRNAGSTL